MTLAALSAACSGKTAAPAAPSATAWAVVDGREISGDDVEKAYRRVSQGQTPGSDEELLSAKLAVLNELIVQDILLAKARALKLEVPDSELDAAFNEGKKNIPDDAFQQELAKRKLSAADMRDGIKRELLSQKLIDQEVTAKISVTEQEVKEFFEAHKAQFNVPETSYHVAQIVVTPVRDPQINNRSGDDATTPEMAAQKAQMLMARLKSGAQFAELARDFSEDPQSAPRGGDLGLVPLSALNQAPPLLRDAVLKSAPGTVSAVTGGGAHSLVLVVAKEEAGQRDLSTAEVRDGITNTLKQRREQLLRAAFLSAVRNDATVVNVIAKRVLESPGKLPTLMPAAPGAAK
ncbi:MAG: peptidylprolyl isomerase [Acidobacteriota bacterium]